MDTLYTKAPEIVDSLTYEGYKVLVAELIEQNRTSGDEQTEQKIGFTKLNQQRMKRVEKQFSILPELSEILQQHQPNWQWLVLVEAWCGDGAQLLPAIAGIAAETPSVELAVLLRDENPALMDTCLTNGSRAIPKIICIDVETGERVFTWGPRPAAIQEQVVQFKAENPGIDHETLVQQIQLWYAKDKSQALQQDLLQLIQEALANTVAEAAVSIN